MDWVSRRLPAVAVFAALLLMVASAARAGDVQVSLTVALVSESDAGVESTPAAARAHAILGKQLRYSSLKVLESSRHRIADGELWSHGLPNGTSVKARAGDISDAGVLLSVDWKGSAQGDFRVQRGKPLVIGGPNYQDGRLVLILQPDF